ncbi:WD40 repeat-like protein [Thozetella sp. PMI_491]|nr:WD40 repeat-like protein [Thozetella sp. PMI_491]
MSASCIYASALIFSPTQSLIRRQFQAEEPQWMITKPRMDSRWSACLTTLEGHRNLVRSIAWSSDGRLASGSSDHTIKIWDPTTGQCTATLEGHRRSVRSIAWSSDGLLASGSSDQTIKIWHPTTGQCTATLEIGSITFLKFDISTPQYLHTSVGTVDLGPTITSRSLDTNTNLQILLPQAVGYGLRRDKTWVTYRGEDLLWLPSEYRPDVSAILEGSIGLGFRSRRVLILRFSRTPLVPKHYI